MPLTSTLTINGTSFTATQRASAHVLPTGLVRVLDGGNDQFTFSEIPAVPAPTYKNGQLVSLEIDLGNGEGPKPYFSGMIVDCQSEHGPMGWQHGYTCLGLRYLADRISITAVDGTGTAVYNRSPLDDYYTPSDAGLSLGEIIRRILEIPVTAQALNAVGIGGYTGLPSAPTLPADTLADLAALTVVPPRTVIFQGESILNSIDQEISQWMPKWFTDLQPDGKIRIRDSTDLVSYFPPQTITCPSAAGAGDPVSPPRVQRSTRNCATRLILRGGPQVEVATLSLVDGTLAEVFTSGDKTAWDLTYFTAPKGATDYGTITATTSTSATLSSHDASATWPANSWSDNEAVITLIDSLATGISQFETRRVTSNNALTAGGTSTVNWDSTWPITSTTYDQYRITGGAGGLNDCWRTYTPREPSTGKTGLDTFVGAHLVTRSAIPVKVANAQQSFGAYFTTALVVGGSLGQELPLGIQAVPSEGIFRFTQPTVTVFGQTSKLNLGSPTTAADGKPLDVVVYALYSRGPLSVVVPPDVGGVPQYEGTAYTEDGYVHTKMVEFPAWLWLNDTSSFGELAQQFLDTMSNTEVDVSIDWYITPIGPSPTWDFLSFGYSLNIAIAGQTSPWSNLNAPIRSIGLKWDWTGQGAVIASFQASTRRRAFSGADLYIHPEFDQGSPLLGAFNGAAGNYEAYGQFLTANGLGGSLGTGFNGNFQEWNQDLSHYGSPGFVTPHDVINASGMPGSGFGLQDALSLGQPIGRPAGIASSAARPRPKPKPEPTYEPLDPGKKQRDQFLNDLVKPLTSDMVAGLERQETAKRNADKFGQGIVDSAVKSGLQPLNNARLAAQKKAENDRFYAERGQRNLDKAIETGRTKEVMRQKGEERDQERARAEMERMLKGSTGSGVPFSEQPDQ